MLMTVQVYFNHVVVARNFTVPRASVESAAILKGKAYNSEFIRLTQSELKNAICGISI
jgi:hypothetical protein